MQGTGTIVLVYSSVVTKLQNCLDGLIIFRILNHLDDYNNKIKSQSIASRAVVDFMSWGRPTYDIIKTFELLTKSNILCAIVCSLEKVNFKV